MEIFTLLKANIRHKKGSFVSIIILMLIISMSFTAVFSIKENCSNSIQNALDNVNAGDLNMIMNADMLSNELLESVENHSLVKDVVVKEAVATVETKFGDEKTDNSMWAMVKLTDEYRLLNEDLSGYADEVPELKSGEIYVPQAVNTTLGCNIGDKIELNTVNGKNKFTIKGYVVEPLLGSMNIGFKQVFISDEDFDRLHTEAVEKSTPEKTSDYRVVYIYKADESMSDVEFKRQINLDTGILDYTDASLLKTQSFDVTNIYPNVILNVLLIFVGFLVGIVLIVMAHSISTSIEMEYTSLGVLKAQGFSENKIKTIFGLQYVFVEIIGAIVGIALAIPFATLFGGVFQPISGIPNENNISILVSLLFVLAVLAVSVVFILVSTHKIGKVSPMKAISGGKNDIHFDSRLNAPITKKALSSSLALRQFTSNKHRYIGTMIIIAILMFFMITINVLANSVDSKSSMDAMGVTFTELQINYKNSVSDSTVEEVESIITKHSEIEKKLNYTNISMSINGNSYFCSVYKNPESIIMEEGRYPQYDNEIAITEFLAEELKAEIGDKVTVAYKNYKQDCIITGISINANNMGLNFSMPFECAKTLDLDDVLFCNYSLKNPASCTAIADELNEKYFDILSVKASESNAMLESYAVVGYAMTAIIYAISIVFSLVVVMMVCKKAFLQERKDIGIYKSLGFTSSKLRLQFAVRFLIMSLIGSVFGIGLSVLFTKNALTEVLKLTGISSVNAQFTALSFIVPISIIAVSFFVFAYFASRKIKKVEIKELVIE